MSRDLKLITERPIIGLIKTIIFKKIHNKINKDYEMCVYVQMLLIFA